ncbi:hypothetical protein GCM10010377_23880 [Streptomyces viridiviolaceus]|uniref:hypothetical protein n=1 Tax=Streptomyces viridiviolaceus TaxID=68282 RepID=UPI00167BDADD|nr:hypothetical protein [Streptomyces viridiviolaceus]GHB32673.1 hypothetical protein GCM10010377_23880 [Streptomyces viridiviolaceus]
MTIFLTGATVRDGVADAPGGQCDVLVDGDRIVSIEVTVRPPDGAEVVDLSGTH